ncbi:phage tail protein [Bacillus sp. FJAT-27264]|uniref:tail protein X n=1 Tax=Paenibacillus sp. (strain DSM 101736 / FJAT-27264) TaxID=1850362 RepID=UPI000807FF29|nr:tail protein X [Bacillus sp. FJAT-27264]OBZ08930.1 phage tail protein [Bacillus sp. FJAT-27264]
MIYSTLQGDTWDGIAFKLYGDAHLMTILINANPNHASTVVFSANVSLVVPDKPMDTSDTLPPWRREE